MAPTALVKDLLKVPKQIHEGDFVLKLSEGISNPRSTAETYVVTPMLADAFDSALRLVGAALRDKKSQAPGRMRHVLTSRDVSPLWSNRAVKKLAEIRADYDLDPDGILDLVPDGQGMRLWTFGGGKANNILGRVLESKLGDKITLNNLYIGFREGAAESDSAIRSALAQLREEGRPNHEDAVRFAETCARGPISKFQPCLPEHLEAEFYADLLTDAEEAREAIAVRH